MTISRDTFEKIKTYAFIELFGKNMTLVDLIIWTLALIMIVLLLNIANQDYSICRRRKLPGLPSRAE